MKPMWASDRELLNLGATFITQWGDVLEAREDSEIEAIGIELKAIAQKMERLYFNSRSYQRPPSEL